MNIKRLKDLIEDDSYMEDLPENYIGDFWINISGYNYHSIKGILGKAVSLKDYDMIKSLIRLIPYGEMDDLYLHRTAIRNGRLDIIKLLINKNIKPRLGFNVLAEAVEVGDMVFINIYEDYVGGYIHGSLSYLRAAINSGDVEILKYILEKTGIHSDFSHLLDEAICSSNEMLKLLLDNGADPNISYFKPLERAVNKNNLGAVKLLVEYGANYNFLQGSAFRRACERGYIDIVKYFLTLDIKTDGYNNYGIRWAKKNNHLEIVELIKEYQGARNK